MTSLEIWGTAGPTAGDRFLGLATSLLSCLVVALMRLGMMHGRTGLGRD